MMPPSMQDAQDALCAHVADLLRAAGLPLASDDGARPGYRPFRGQAPEGPATRILLRWVGLRCAAQLQAAIPVLAGLECRFIAGPPPVLSIVDTPAARRARTKAALLAGLGAAPETWAALWAAYWAARGQVAPPAAAPLNWHEWQEPDAAPQEEAA